MHCYMCYCKGSGKSNDLNLNRSLTTSLKSIKLQVTGEVNNPESDKSAISVILIYGFGGDEAHFHNTNKHKPKKNITVLNDYQEVYAAGCREAIQYCTAGHVSGKRS